MFYVNCVWGEGRRSEMKSRKRKYNMINDELCITQENAIHKQSDIHELFHHTKKRNLWTRRDTWKIANPEVEPRKQINKTMNHRNETSRWIRSDESMFVENQLILVITQTNATQRQINTHEQLQINTNWSNNQCQNGIPYLSRKKNDGRSNSPSTLTIQKKW